MSPPNCFDPNHESGTWLLHKKMKLQAPLSFITLLSQEDWNLVRNIRSLYLKDGPALVPEKWEFLSMI